MMGLVSMKKSCAIVACAEKLPGAMLASGGYIRFAYYFIERTTDCKL